MGRGPSYPFVDLEAAIGLTQKIYDYTKRSAASTDAIVEHALKYSLKSSGGIKVLAALKSYGLTEELNGNKAKTTKITDSAYRILVDDPESPERREAIQAAALAPKWYRFCWDKWGPSPPPSMRSTLLVNYGFIPTTVDSFLRDYKKTLDFAGLQEASEDQGPSNLNGSVPKSNFKIGEYVQWESQGMLRMPAARKLTHYSPGGDFAFVEGALTGIPAAELIAAEPPEPEPAEQFTPPNIFIPAILKPGAPGGAKMQTETFALPEGVTGQLQWPSTMSAEAYEDFVYQLEGLKRRVSRAVRKDTSGAGVSSQHEGG
jgi:hypothetical protein